MKKILFVLAILVLAAPFQPARAAEFNDAQKAEIDSMIKDTIMANPQLLIESLEAHRVAEEKRMEEESLSAAKNLIPDLKKSNAPRAGAADGDVVMAEFMDYNCGYCKKAFEEVQAVLKDNKDVTVYFVEMPILGPTSHEASKWALAAHKQDKYFAFHTALMEFQGQKSDDVLENLAEKAGLDVAQARKDKDGEEVAAQLDANLALANTIGITGTPGFIIGEDIMRGYITLDQMNELIAKNRGGKTE